MTSANLPYSSETLDMYLKLSSSSPLSTLQTYEATLQSLAIATSQRSVRFQPAKSPLRAFIHSLATDWGFASESFDPEPHRHVFVLKPTTWTPPPFGIGQDTGIGIGGMSVGECVKLRERQRLKERETQRLAAAETKAQREAAKAQASATGEGGWAQVAASRRSNSGINSARSVTPVAQGPSALSSSTMYAALAGDDGSGSWRTGPGGASSLKKEKLVLRSGVGAGKQLRSQPPPPAEVADNWEEEEEKEEQEERAREEDDPNDANDNLGQDDEQRSAPSPEADPEPAHGHEQKPDPAQEPLNEPGQATENIQVLDASMEQLPHEPAPTHEPSTTTS